MNNVLRARKGMKWVLTELGMEVPRVRSKFEITSPNFLRYSRAVPVLWYQKGYVIEVKEEENGS